MKGRYSILLVVCVMLTLCFASAEVADTATPTSEGDTAVVDNAPSVEDLLNRYFMKVANVEDGVAGATLKQAIMARDVLSFAHDSNLRDADIPTLRSSMLAAWEAMDADAQSDFDENLTGLLIPLADAVFNGADDDTIGVFEDAGIADEMALLAEDEAARASWETLLANTLTLGNSDDSGDA